jgi:hypothetical protein
MSNQPGNMYFVFSSVLPLGEDKGHEASDIQPNDSLKTQLSLYVLIRSVYTLYNEALSPALCIKRLNDVYDQLRMTDWE